jgi:hypothetical protein
MQPSPVPCSRWVEALLNSHRQNSRNGVRVRSELRIDAVGHAERLFAQAIWETSVFGLRVNTG